MLLRAHVNEGISWTLTWKRRWDDDEEILVTWKVDVLGIMSAAQFAEIKASTQNCGFDQSVLLEKGLELYDMYPNSAPAATGVLIDEISSQYAGPQRRRDHGPPELTTPSFIAGLTGIRPVLLSNNCTGERPIVKWKDYPYE